MPIPDREDGDYGHGPWITATELRSALDAVGERLGPEFELHRSANGTGNLLFASTNPTEGVLGMIDLASAEVSWWE